MVCIDFKIKLSFCGEYTPREVGVNLKQGYNGDLTSREAGSVGGQMVKKMCPERTLTFPRTDRTAPGHQASVSYIAVLTF
ncbi:alpha/beta-type small acid-soluble spore protein [Intestinimonas massiliensis]|uniref:Alpha/beta-type small acid-soluble spore protein n=1 Tax=Intestinimonas massiliensis (ex Afouda et al. 2020) TaxID=1673721 RepID=A0ABS9MCM1_9FIRM|nr:alpha/beta-type small acid-soluble spore protein [Intestinimonas massiliensis (ex Afouda et al. 2020)]MCG4528358.1 alpha/beta-type small acid-soluble spore protein [Intestinimonas massiliensis (ex Afouda et al. 2020)]MCQ4807870.1 alpha/beta-type small acid-soluble spore protein [Intestinimonas massiliensis (ex Afouda et al. 2020)]